MSTRSAAGAPGPAGVTLSLLAYAFLVVVARSDPVLRLELAERSAGQRTTRCSGGLKLHHVAGDPCLGRLQVQVDPAQRAQLPRPQPGRRSQAQVQLEVRVGRGRGE